MTTDTDICNLALDILKESPISSIDDARPVAMWCKRNFSVSRDSLLVRADWNFALKRASLPADVTPPAFGWGVSYTLPADCLRLIPLTQCGNYEGRPIPHEVEDGKILTNANAPLKIRYVARVEAYASYPAVFIEALAGYMAMKCAHWVTGKQGYQQIAQGLFAEAMRNAWLVDAIEGTSPRAADNEWVAQR